MKKYEDILFFEAGWEGDEEDRQREEIAKSYSVNLVNMNLITQTNIDGKPTTLGKAILDFIDANENVE